MRRRGPASDAAACAYALGRYDESLTAYGRALAIDPAGYVAHRGVGLVYMARFLKDRRNTELREKGLQAWRRSLELNGDQKDLAELIRRYTPPAQGGQ